MARASCVILVMLGLGTLLLAAQSANQQPRPTIIVHTPALQNPSQPVSSATAVSDSTLNHCPVVMRAEHLSDGSMVRTGNAAHPAGIGQRLHLSLISQEKKQITSAILTVHGMTPKGRMTETLTAGSGAYDATQEIYVSFASGPNETAIASIWVQGMSAVEMIDLKSVEYGDGSKWEPADGSSCEVRPDPLMLITER